MLSSTLLALTEQENERLQIMGKKNKSCRLYNLQLYAVWTGLEPATPCVTGRYSNQLNYHTVPLLLCKDSISNYNYQISGVAGLSTPPNFITALIFLHMINFD